MDTSSSTISPPLDIDFLNLPSRFHLAQPESRSLPWWSPLTTILERKDGASDDETEEGLLALGETVEMGRRKYRMAVEIGALFGVGFLLLGLVVVCMRVSGRGVRMESLYPPLG